MEGVVGGGICKVRVRVNGPGRLVSNCVPSGHPCPTTPLALYAVPRLFLSLLLSKQDGMWGCGTEVSNTKPENIDWERK